MACVTAELNKGPQGLYCDIVIRWDDLYQLLFIHQNLQCQDCERFATSWSFQSLNSGEYRKSCNNLEQDWCALRMELVDLVAHLLPHVPPDRTGPWCQLLAMIERPEDLRFGLGAHPDLNLDGDLDLRHLPTDDDFPNPPPPPLTALEQAAAQASVDLSQVTALSELFKQSEAGSWQMDKGSSVISSFMKRFVQPSLQARRFETGLEAIEALKEWVNPWHPDIRLELQGGQLKGICKHCDSMTYELKPALQVNLKSHRDKCQGQMASSSSTLSASSSSTRSDTATAVFQAPTAALQHQPPNPFQHPQ
eukprot:m.294271 g.294271  ORF g.294271 m.294271 type:complete len:307 (+) comp41397_c0_seq1:2-922(+)